MQSPAVGNPRLVVSRPTCKHRITLRATNEWDSRSWERVRQSKIGSRTKAREFPVVQWLRLGPLTAMGPGWIPVGPLRSHILKVQPKEKKKGKMLKPTYRDTSDINQRNTVDLVWILIQTNQRQHSILRLLGKCKYRLLIGCYWRINVNLVMVVTRVCSLFLVVYLSFDWGMEGLHDTRNPNEVVCGEK